ncbi:MAG: diacylglycerol kinase family lipid kinase [Gammaproteobacteria bacterium]|nr:MAG: diacylglycerol kinase family lipid kinase [Gammaproteobacteria bacterium]
MTDTCEAHLFINGFAGRGRAARQAENISHRLWQGGLRLTTAETRSPGSLIDQLAVACESGAKIVLIAGGDGSVNEAINGIMEADADPRLGVIPLGTGNDFAKTLGIPLAWRRACDRIIDGIGRPETDARIDVGRCNERFFLNGVGIGFDARVAIVANRMKWPAGQIRYPLALAKTLMSGIQIPRVKIVTDESVLEMPITLISAMNGRIAGGIFPLAPDARINDGQLDIVIADGMNRRQVMRLLPRLMKGTHLSLPAVTLIRSRTLKLETSLPLAVQTDGEILTAAARNLDIELIPGRLSVIGGRPAE